MPIYIFENVRTNERKEIFQKMSERHVYSDESEDEWKRVWQSPQMSVSSLSLIDPYDSKAFAKATADKKGTYGDLFNSSRELSELRKSNNGGHDPIEQKYYQDYSKARRGKVHKNQRMAELKTSLDKKGIEVEI